MKQCCFHLHSAHSHAVQRCHRAPNDGRHKQLRGQSDSPEGFIYLLQYSSAEKKYVRWESLPHDAKSDYVRRNPHATKEEKAGRFLPPEHLKKANSRSRRAQTQKKSRHRAVWNFKEQHRKASYAADKHRYIVVVFTVSNLRPAGDEFSRRKHVPTPPR